MFHAEEVSLPKKVRSRDGSMEGEVAGRAFPCRLEGCRGVWIPVKWPDGSRTYPCSEGMMAIAPDVWQM